MIIIPLKVEHVAGQLMLSLCLSIYLLFKIRVFFLHFVKFVTFIVATSCRSVITPFAQAHPTKIVFTKLAGHVVATLILFNWSFTARALFGVRHNPSDILTLSTSFDVPLLCCFTVTWLVRTLITCKAETHATLTMDFHIRSKLLSFKAEFTTKLRTPLD